VLRYTHDICHVFDCCNTLTHDHILTGFTYACFIRGVAVLILLYVPVLVDVSFVSNDVCEVTVLKVFIYAVFPIVFVTPHSCLRKYVNLNP
jgi:hypothetical protein